MTKKLKARELQKADIKHIANYWLNSDPDFLIEMGVDLAKLPSEAQLTNMLEMQLKLPYVEKHSYCIIWEIDEKPVGHCNINKIAFGEEAYMHLHLWKTGQRKSGVGTALIKRTLPYFFKNYKLKKLYCEPNAKNPAPNKTLEKIGFKFLKKYTTIPGSLNFEQEVNRWVLSARDYQSMK